MKNIRIIDGADNCTFSVFQATNDESDAIFPGAGQDIEFAKDFAKRAGKKKGTEILAGIWERPIEKKKAKGIHGTMFFGFKSRRRHFPATRREKDWNLLSLDTAQRQLYRRT